MPKGIAKGGTAKKTTKKPTRKPVSQKKPEIVKDETPLSQENVNFVNEVENQSQETPQIEEIATPTLQPVVEETKTSPRGENDRLNAENVKAQAELESRNKEIKNLNYNISAEQQKLNKTKEELEVLTSKNEGVLRGIEAKEMEVRETLRKIEEATNIARSESDDHFAKTQELTKLNNEIQASNSTLDYLANQARSLVEIMRMETIKYVQMNGIDIKIDYLTEEQKEIIAKTLAPSVCKLTKVEERVYN